MPNPGAGSGSAEYPRRGHLLRDFVLTSAAGMPVQLSDYRGRSNLVLILLGASRNDPAGALLADLAAQYASVLEEEAQVLAVVQAPREQAEALRQRAGLPFLVLADPGGEVHRALGAEAESAAAAAAYVTDRFGEVYAAWRAREGQVLPTVGEILEWLQFINIQCPECFPPEWPAA